MRQLQGSLFLGRFFYSMPQIAFLAIPHVSLSFSYRRALMLSQKYVSDYPVIGNASLYVSPLLAGCRLFADTILSISPYWSPTIEMCRGVSIGANASTWRVDANADAITVDSISATFIVASDGVRWSVEVTTEAQLQELVADLPEGMAHMVIRYNMH